MAMSQLFYSLLSPPIEKGITKVREDAVMWLLARFYVVARVF